MATERESFAKRAAKKYSKGRYTATQTGARQIAEKDATGSMDAFEAIIAGKKQRPTRTKR